MIVYNAPESPNLVRLADLLPPGAVIVEVESVALTVEAEHFQAFVDVECESVTFHLRETAWTHHDLVALTRSTLAFELAMTPEFWQVARQFLEFSEV